jgi:hypothetical protein
VARNLRACPFSGGSCKGCPIYIGRHSQICFAARHSEGHRPKPTYGCTHLELQFPEDLLFGDVPLKDLEDREENITEANIVWKK